jgi:hypothetical protein
MAESRKYDSTQSCHILAKRCSVVSVPDSADPARGKYGETTFAVGYGPD